MSKNKLKWEKPKLIILVRGEPGEAALSACKVEFTGNGPNFQHRECENFGGDFECVGCAGISAS